MKKFLIILGLLAIIKQTFATKLDYETCRKKQCGSSNMCGTNTTCQADLNTFYKCYTTSVNCQNIYDTWLKMKENSVIPITLSSCITDCSGPYKSQEVNSYFSCLKNTCLPLGYNSQSTSSNILSITFGLIILIMVLF